MFQAGKNDRRREKTYDKRKKEKGDRRKMDGKETAKRKQVLEGNAFYEIDLECMRKKEKREEMEKREREARKPKRFRWKRILVKKSPGAVDPHPGLFLPEHLGGLKKVSSRIHSYCCCRIHSRCCSIRRSRTEESERASSRNCSHCCCFRIHIRRSRRGEAESR